jgi:trk system potassium uptake protein TrkA
MKKQVLIIGLGQFGMALTRSLAERGTEVLAVDKRQSLVDLAASFATEAMTLDATDQDALAKLRPAERDAVVCAIGGDSKESSIICTALLRQMGVSYVVARGVDVIHNRILHLVGAHRVINPEQEFGHWFANRVLYQEILSEAPLGGGLHISEVLVPNTAVGKTLQELQLPKRFGITVVAVRGEEANTIHIPNPFEPLIKDHRLLIVSDETAIRKFVKELST